MFKVKDCHVLNLKLSVVWCPYISFCSTSSSVAIDICCKCSEVGDMVQK